MNPRVLLTVWNRSRGKRPEVECISRFVGHGPRDDNTTRDEFDFVVGMEGSIFDDNVFDAFARHYFYSASNSETPTSFRVFSRILLRPALMMSSIHLSGECGLECLASSATLTRDLDTKFNQVGVSLSAQLSILVMALLDGP